MIIASKSERSHIVDVCQCAILFVNVGQKNQTQNHVFFLTE